MFYVFPNFVAQTFLIVFKFENSFLLKQRKIFFG